MDAMIKPGTIGDLRHLVAIYNHWIEIGAATFDVEPLSVDERVGWFERFSSSGPHRLLVAQVRHDVVGYAASTPFRPKAAYRATVEISVYLTPAATGAGLGRRLGEALLLELEGEAHRAVAVIAQGSDAALRLVGRLGFRRVGTLTEAGFKHGRYWDVEVWERAL